MCTWLFSLIISHYIALHYASADFSLSEPLKLAIFLGVSWKLTIRFPANYWQCVCVKNETINKHALDNWSSLHESVGHVFGGEVSSCATMFACKLNLRQEKCQENLKLITYWTFTNNLKKQKHSITFYLSYVRFFFLSFCGLVLHETHCVKNCFWWMTSIAALDENWNSSRVLKVSTKGVCWDV